MNSVKTSTKYTVNISEADKNLTVLGKEIKEVTSDSSLLFLFKQHCRTEFIIYNFVNLLAPELFITTNENL